MKFKDLLKGENEAAQEALNKFFQQIENQEEKILWYPSSGMDYRTTVEMQPERLLVTNLPESANIICHTDYYHTWTKLHEPIPEEGKFFFESNRTSILITEKHNLCFSDNVKFDYENGYYNRYYNHYFDEKPIHPIVYLLKIKIISNLGIERDAYVFYFILENYHFLEELIIKQKLPLTHFVKVREGCGFGGCRNCISVIYSLLGNIGVKYLLVDDEIHYDKRIHDTITRRWNINHQNIKLTKLNNTRIHWSFYHVNVFKIDLLKDDLDKNGLDDILKTIHGEEYDFRGEKYRFYVEDSNHNIFRQSQ
jgi:hypothetical protein